MLFRAPWHIHMVLVRKKHDTFGCYSLSTSVNLINREVLSNLVTPYQSLLESSLQSRIAGHEKS